MSKEANISLLKTDFQRRLEKASRDKESFDEADRRLLKTTFKKNLTEIF